MQRSVGITETLFRDAHQSLLATRLRLEHMLTVAELIDQAGYHSVEVWGATFDTCLRYLNEDPWKGCGCCGKDAQYKTADAAPRAKPGGLPSIPG